MTKEQSEGTGVRQAKKQATRERLLAAALDILVSDGIAGLTTARIAQGASIAQSGFYVHFESINACLAALGADIAGTLVDLEAGLRRRRLPNLPPEKVLEDAAERMRIVLTHCVEHRQQAELLLRFRLDPTPLGQSIRSALRRAERLLVQDLWDVAASLGLRGACLPQVQLIAAMLASAFAGALELCVLDDTYDVDTVATALARAQFHYAFAELMRLKAEQTAGDKAARKK